MSSSTYDVAPSDPIRSADHNTLRSAIIDLTVGHHHDASDSRQILHSDMGGLSNNDHPIYIDISGMNSPIRGDLVFLSGVMADTIDLNFHDHRGTAQYGTAVDHFNLLNTNSVSGHMAYMRQSGEVRNLITSGGMVVQGTISGHTISITSGLTVDMITARTLNISGGMFTAAASGIQLNLTSGLVADTVSSKILSATSGTFGSILIAGATILSGAVTIGGLATALAGVTTTILSGINIHSSGLTVDGAATISGVFTVGGLAIENGGTLTTTLSGINVNTSGLTVGGASILSGLVAANAGIVTTTESSRFINTSGLTVGGASVLSGTATIGGLVAANAGITTTTMSSQNINTSGLTVGGAAIISGGITTTTLSSLFMNTSSLNVGGAASISGNLNFYGAISGTANASLIATGSLNIARMPQGATSGQVLTAQGAGVAPAFANRQRNLYVADDVEQFISGTTAGTIKVWSMMNMPEVGINITKVGIAAELKLNTGLYSGQVDIFIDSGAVSSLSLYTRSSGTYVTQAGQISVAWDSGSIHTFALAAKNSASGSTFNRNFEVWIE